MTNDTLQLLEEVVFGLEKKLLQRDAAYTLRKQEENRLYEKFRAGYAGEESLLQEVDDLLFAVSGSAERRNEFRLFLGLQMGLELGCLNLLHGRTE